MSLIEFISNYTNQTQTISIQYPLKLVIVPVKLPHKYVVYPGVIFIRSSYILQFAVYKKQFTFADISYAVASYWSSILFSTSLDDQWISQGLALFLEQKALKAMGVDKSLEIALEIRTLNIIKEIQGDLFSF